MNFFEKILYFLQAEMTAPEAWGWFHFLWIGLTILSIIVLYKLRNRYSEKQLKTVLAIYGIIALMLEVTKQLIWSFNYNPETLTKYWDFQWYASPFQFCTTPIYVCLIALFFKKNKCRDSLLAYVAFFTILGSLMTILIPDSCFTKTIEVNIHTMFLHCGSFVISIYLLMNEVKLNYKNLVKGFYVLLIFVLIANTLNITFYNLNIVGDETFNMFYISPYFISELPVYSTVQQSVPYIIYLIFYIFSMFVGGNIIYFLAGLITKVKKLTNRKICNNF